MDDELRKIDLIRERAGLSYREAKALLDEAEGNLVDALIKAEEKGGPGWTDKVMDKGEELGEQVKSYIKKGNRTKIRLKKEDRTLAEIPATFGVLGVVAALASPPLAVVAGIGAVAALANKVSLEIAKPDGETNVVSLNRRRDEEDRED